MPPEPLEESARLVTMRLLERCWRTVENLPNRAGPIHSVEEAFLDGVDWHKNVSVTMAAVD